MPIFREYTSISSEVHTKLITLCICVCKVVQQLFMEDLNEKNTLRIAKYAKNSELVVVICVW